MPGQRKYTFLAIVTVTICVMALYVHRHQQGQTGAIDNTLISVTGGLQKHLYYFGAGARTIVDRYLLLVQAKRRSEELDREVDYLRVKLAALQEVELENGRLREALRFQDTIEQNLLAAHVVANDVSSDYYSIRIDKGSASGVKVGMGVISPSGLVGRIQRAAPQYADVVTLVDPTSAVDAVVQRSRARGILSGQGTQLTCRFKYLDRLEDVAVGDTVVSSGFGGIFPKGLLIGHISGVEPHPTGILQTVTVKSAVNIFRLEEVFVVFPPAEPAKVAE